MKKSLFSARRPSQKNGQLGLMETGCIEESLMRRGLRMGRDEDSVLEFARWATDTLCPIQNVSKSTRISSSTSALHFS